ncbi:ABC transporter substrate-binding protein [Auritidibacter ignavus]|uniref:ABC transporter substrate-binding protein n=1 Tax=Auritidibacter ignavus TaxID=678932 RepID=UPI00109C7C22|nr:ABC transporter substrate-binding protein [Auritidibacter ignavus]
MKHHHHIPDPRPAGLHLNRRQLLGGALGLGALGVLSACSAPPVTQVDTSGPPTQGGTLRVGLAGGSATDSLDAHAPVNSGDTARVINLYEGLLRRDDNYELEYRLAESMEVNDDATEWRLVLREGVRFSDGRPVRPEDVIATVERVRNPDDPKNGASMMEVIDSMEVVDERTLIFKLSTPDAELDDAFSQYQMGIVPEDYDPSAPIGAGPFTLGEFEPGQITTLNRNDNYWDTPAHLDRVELVNFQEEDAMLNALLSTQVDAIGQINPALTRVVDADERLQVLNSETGMWLPFTMRVDTAPFDDVKVRQAMRLAIDRDQMVNQVFSGHGQLGNDMFAFYDPGYPDHLEQRQQDIEQAKQLLSEAGYPDGLEVDLVTSEIQAGAVRAAQVLAEQVQDAGITVNLHQVDTTTFYGDGNYLHYPFSQSFWYTRNFLAQVDQCATDTAPFNETHWEDPDFAARVSEAQATADNAEREGKIAELQEEFFDRGGYIIWGFSNQVDAMQKYVMGFDENATGLPLSGYNFQRAWIAEVNA